MADPDPVPERRALSNPLDVAGALAMLYTFGFLGTVGLLFYVQIPADNREAVLQVLGLMSAIEMAIIGAYFGASKNAETMQRAAAEMHAKTEATVQEIAKAAPVAAAAVVASTIPAEPIKADNVNVAADTVVIDQPKKEP